MIRTLALFLVLSTPIPLLASAFGTAATASNTTQSSVTSLATSSTLNTAVGDLLVVFMRWTSATATATVCDGGSCPGTSNDAFTCLTTQNGSNSGNVRVCYSIGAKAASTNSVIAEFSAASTFNVIYVWDVPISGTVLFDTQAGAIQASTVASVTSSAFTTTGTDEYVPVGIASNCLNENPLGISQSGYTSDNSNISASGIAGSAHGVYSSTQSGVTVTMTVGNTCTSEIALAAFKGTAANTFVPQVGAFLVGP